MIKCVKAYNVLPPNLKIKAKITHSLKISFKYYCLKIKQSFVKKRQFLMPSLIYKLLTISIFVIAPFSTPVKAYKFHPFYVSVTEMNYNEKSQSFEISCKMFAEDI